MIAAKRHDVVKELATANADPALANRVLPGAAKGRPDGLYAHGFDGLDGCFESLSSGQ